VAACGCLLVCSCYNPDMRGTRIVKQSAGMCVMCDCWLEVW
jgi:hypothetical protein